MSKRKLTQAEQYHQDEARAIGCLLGNRGYECNGPRTIHHIAQGSGQRNEYNTVCLCNEHHQGSAGIHGMGSKAFIRLYRPPGDIEHGLLTWLNEDRAKKRL